MFLKKSQYSRHIHRKTPVLESLFNKATRPAKMNFLTGYFARQYRKLRWFVLKFFEQLSRQNASSCYWQNNIFYLAWLLIILLEKMFPALVSKLLNKVMILPKFFKFFKHVLHSKPRPSKFQRSTLGFSLPASS